MTDCPLRRARAGWPHVAVLAIALLCGCCAGFAPRAVAAPADGAWDAVQQRQVLAAGLMQANGRSFDGAGALTASQANTAMAALTTMLQGTTGQQGAYAQPGAAGAAGTAGPSAPAPARTARSPVTVSTLDRMLVQELGLAGVASHVQAGATAAGLQPPSYFGTEVVARFLQLRYEHPVGAQRLDLFPTDPVTRAEAAWSLATVLHAGAWTLSGAREALSAFELPSLSPAQRQVLQIAVSRVGYPYVWGGTTDDTADGLEHGGFDCSGFVWRVFKVSGLPWGQAIHGRTAAEQAGEIPRSARLRAAQLQPGDLLFFGSARLNSSATERNVVHEGIYLGENWVIHSSAEGVYVLPLSASWLGSSFAWGRRVLY